MMEDAERKVLNSIGFISREEFDRFVLNWRPPEAKAEPPWKTLKPKESESAAD